MIPVVKQAFERAYGPIPEGATCHVCYGINGGFCQAPAYINDIIYAWDDIHLEWDFISDYECGPDISDRPASAFV